MVTIWALCCGVFPALLFVIYDPSLYSSYPVILYVLAAVGLFMYQTLDALDGKQARRIKAFSPLGQLFDHGCDSFSTASVTIFLLVCLRIPDAKLNLLIYLAGIVIVYMSNLTEKFTHVLMTSYGQIGVTEIQLAQCLFLLMTGFGLTGWLYVPIVGDYSLNYLAAYGIIALPFYANYVLIKKILATDTDRKELVFTIAPLLSVFVMSN
jgi:phosphatidylglycerophosphate synthase